MPEDSYATIRSLLASAEPEELRRGLELVRQEIARVGSGEARELFEIVSALFYIDPLDRPDLLPILDDAVSLVVGFGRWVIPVLVDRLDCGDLKAQMAISHALGRIGADAIDPLAAAYAASDDPARRCFILYAMGKIKSPEVARAVALPLEAARSPDLELRDTAVRAIGKLSESIPPGRLNEETRRSLVETLRASLADPNAGIRAKAVRSLGKLAKHGHLAEPQREAVRGALRRLSGDDESFDWDRAFIVRKEAAEALRHL